MTSDDGKKAVSRRGFLKGIGVGAGALTLGRIGIVQAALLPKAARAETYNVVVIGTGLAGRSAALEARLGGAEVILLEKMVDGKDGGNSKVAMGSIVVPLDRTPGAADMQRWGPLPQPV